MTGEFKEGWKEYQGLMPVDSSLTPDTVFIHFRSQAPAPPVPLNVCMAATFLSL